MNKTSIKNNKKKKFIKLLVIIIIFKFYNEKKIDTFLSIHFNALSKFLF